MKLRTYLLFLLFLIINSVSIFAIGSISVDYVLPNSSRVHSSVFSRYSRLEVYASNNVSCCREIIMNISNGINNYSSMLNDLGLSADAKADDGIFTGRFDLNLYNLAPVNYSFEVIFTKIARSFLNVTILNDTFTTPIFSFSKSTNNHVIATINSNKNLFWYNGKIFKQIIGLEGQHLTFNLSQTTPLGGYRSQEYTLNFPDYTPPTNSSLTCEPINNGRISLKWTRSKDNVALKGYEIFRRTINVSLNDSQKKAMLTQNFPGSESNFTDLGFTSNTSFIDKPCSSCIVLYYIKSLDEYYNANNSNMCRVAPDRSPPSFKYILLYPEQTFIYQSNDTAKINLYSKKFLFSINRSFHFTANSTAEVCDWVGNCENVSLPSKSPLLNFTIFNGEIINSTYPMLTFLDSFSENNIFNYLFLELSHSLPLLSSKYILAKKGKFMYLIKNDFPSVSQYSSGIIKYDPRFYYKGNFRKVDINGSFFIVFSSLQMSYHNCSDFCYNIEYSLSSDLGNLSSMLQSNYQSEDEFRNDFNALSHKMNLHYVIGDNYSIHKSLLSYFTGWFGMNHSPLKKRNPKGKIIFVSLASSFLLLIIILFVFTYMIHFYVKSKNKVKFEFEHKPTQLPDNVMNKIRKKIESEEMKKKQLNKLFDSVKRQDELNRTKFRK